MDARTYPNLNELIDIESEAMKRKQRIDERIFKEDIIQTRYLQWKNLSLFIWLLVWFLKLGYPKSVVRYYKCKKEGESEVKLDRVPAWLWEATGLGNLTRRTMIPYLVFRATILFWLKKYFCKFWQQIVYNDIVNYLERITREPLNYVYKQHLV